MRSPGIEYGVPGTRLQGHGKERAEQDAEPESVGDDDERGESGDNQGGQDRGSGSSRNAAE
jgi:hypothetical protein